MSWIVRADEGVAVPWRNGHGSTRELCRVPDRDDWLWRLSVATSTTSAPFSSFPGVDRELLLLRGEPLELRFRDADVTRLAVGERSRFAGENPVVGVPTSGVTEQLNLMWRRDDVTAETGVGDLPTGLLPHATWLVVHALRTGDTTVLTGDDGVRADPDGPVYWARLSARVGG